MIAPGLLQRYLRVAVSAMLALFVAVVSFAAPTGAVNAQAGTPLLDTFLVKLTADQVFPGADRFGPVQGTPPVAPVYKGQERVGFVYLTSDFVDTAGYSGKPIHVLVALDNAGTIVGLKLVEHHEPIVLIGIPEKRVVDYLASFLGYSPVRASVEGKGPPHADIVSGATVTVLIIGESVTRSALRVSRVLQLGGGSSGATGADRRVIDEQAGSIVDWQALVAQGAVSHLHLTIGEVNRAFAESGNEAAAKRPQAGAPEAGFIDLYVALVSQPAIGRSLLGEDEYAHVRQMLAPGQAAVLVAGDGLYSFKGSGYVRGGIFDRIELVQGAETIRFRDREHRRVGTIAAQGAPALREIGVFGVPQGAEFDPTAPWRLQLLVQRPIGALDKAFVDFPLAYRLPEQYTKRVSSPAPAAAAAANQAAPAAPAAAPAASVGMPAPEAGASIDEAEFPHEPVPLWQRLWRSKAAAIAVLAAMLGVLTIIFFFQNLIVPHEKLFDRIRLAFLAVTLLWLGWVAQAQLSVVNVFTFVQSLRSDFRWETFLVDPLIFILWCSVAAGLLFWGRGPFCGWLCPFGALQELTNRAAKALKVPQLKIPWGVHERLWPIKYIVFLVLFGVSLGSLIWAERLAEIEPFKTAIVLRFLREWWFVAFALALLAAGLFVERFFCRYLCPLGAALAIPGRMRMFDWLRRYRECGNPCMRCFNECPVEAIHPEGHINPNECISCLHCQVLYHHDYKCPVRIQRRVKREKREAMAPTTASVAVEMPVTVRRRVSEGA
ncbi:MAG: NosR/NirI family protein [Burkholderiaceae bacterium]|nr:NosR/NirI family protein [Burkholderiaceae bacterium]